MAALDTPLLMGLTKEKTIGNSLSELEDQKRTMTQAEFEEKRRALIDQATGTKFRKKKKQEFIVPKPPPDFSEMKAENALVFTFDLKKGWTCVRSTVKIEGKPFARGSLRVAYHITLRGEPTPQVAKISIDPLETKTSYFQDVTTQMYAKEYARKYNECRPPKMVDFVAVKLAELIDRDDKPLCTVEQFISGPYRKYNSNFGYVSEEERNTPQTFAHFTYEASGHDILICDIQGVGDLYTDPQIHSRDGRYFGKGNMGQRGFEKFLSSHKCNAICRYLRLPLVNAKLQDEGTVPSQAIMPYALVKVSVSLAMLTADPLKARPGDGDEVGQAKGGGESRSCCCVIL